LLRKPERINAPRPLPNGGKKRHQQRKGGKQKKAEHQARICPRKIREGKAKERGEEERW